MYTNVYSKICVISKIILCSGVRKKNTEIWPQKTSGGTGGLNPRGWVGVDWMKMGEAHTRQSDWCYLSHRNET